MIHKESDLYYKIEENVILKDFHGRDRIFNYLFEVYPYAINTYTRETAHNPFFSFQVGITNNNVSSYLSKRIIKNLMNDNNCRDTIRAVLEDIVFKVGKIVINEQYSYHDVYKNSYTLFNELILNKLLIILGYILKANSSFYPQYILFNFNMNDFSKNKPLNFSYELSIDNKEDSDIAPYLDYLNGCGDMFLSQNVFSMLYTNMKFSVNKILYVKNSWFRKHETNCPLIDYLNKFFLNDIYEEFMSLYEYIIVYRDYFRKFLNNLNFKNEDEIYKIYFLNYKSKNYNNSLCEIKVKRK